MYKLTGDPNIIFRVEDQVYIPKGHPWWLEYEEWLSEGNTAEPQFTPQELAAQQLISVTNQLNTLARQAGAQVTALTNRLGTLDYLINQQDDSDADYIAPTASEIAELPIRKAQLKAWNSYSVKLGRVTAQTTWPASPVWPTMPDTYTTETSSVASESV